MCYTKDLFVWRFIKLRFNCMCLWLNPISGLQNVLTCSLYLAMMSSRADWYSATEVWSSMFSCCNSRIRAFSSWLPKISVLRGLRFATSLRSLTTSWYCKTERKSNHLITYSPKGKTRIFLVYKFNYSIECVVYSNASTYKLNQQVHIASRVLKIIEINFKPNKYYNNIVSRYPANGKVWNIIRHLLLLEISQNKLSNYS